MESPLAAIETNRNIEQETPRAAAGDKDQDQVVRKLLAEVAELRIGPRHRKREGNFTSHRKLKILSAR